MYTTEMTKKAFRLLEDNTVVAEVILLPSDVPYYIISEVAVSQKYQGQGKGSEVLEKFYFWLKENKKEVRVICPFARQWFMEHKDKQDVVIG